MSQLYLTNSGGGGGGGGANSFPTDSGTATPSAGVLNIVTPGGGTMGISTSGSGNNVTISLTTPPIFFTGTSVGTTPTILTGSIATSNNSAISLRSSIVGYDTTANIGIGGELLSTVKNVGGTVTICGNVDSTKNCDAALSTSIFTFVITGTTVQIQVTGVAGDTINWKALVETITVS